jgi:hypothetical protein
MNAVKSLIEDCPVLQDTSAWVANLEGEE